MMSKAIDSRRRMRTKKGRRYRYYVSQAVIKNARNRQHGPVRIPALEIEELVISRLTLLLQIATADAGHSCRGRTHRRQKCMLWQKPPDEWGTATSERIQDLLRSTVKRIIVHNENRNRA